MVTIFLLLTFEGGVYFFGKPVEINEGWKRYVWAIQRHLLGTVISTRSLPYLMSAVEMSCTTNSPRASLQTGVSSYSHMYILLAMTTIQGQRLFCSDVLILWLLFKGSVYSKKYGILCI